MSEAVLPRTPGSTPTPDGSWRGAAARADFSAMLGESPAMQRVRALAGQLCARTLHGATPTILITGETGTGKGLLARCIHENGGRGAQPFIDVNCAAIPPTLLEAELFGHERGTFTDARETRFGLIEAAHGGTLFLDEVACLPFDLQAKLLTAIEEKRVRRLGARAPSQVDIQFIAATHRDLPRMVERGEFRADLYHRLNVVSLRLPPLRERAEDTLLLAERLLAGLCRDYGIPARRFAPGARARITAHSWPGNVRELRNRLERILLLEEGDLVEAKHFDSDDGPPSVRVVQDSGDELKVRLPPQGVRLDRLEREVIRETLILCSKNVSQTARRLGISRQTLIYRMKKYGLSGRRE